MKWSLIMKNAIKHFVAGTFLAMLCAVPGLVSAESNEASGGGTLTASARLNLSVVIPTFLYFQVGNTGAGNIDTITFSPTSDVLGDSSTIAGTGGDAGGGGASVRVRSNAGEITITPTNDGGVGGLGTGAGNISLSEISVASSDPALPTPLLTDAGGAADAVKVTLTAGNVTNRQAVWTYSYDNTTTPEAGTYDAQITYTASSP
jgi:hypothetical protein